MIALFLVFYSTSITALHSDCSNLHSHQQCKTIRNYFIIFDVMVIGIVSMISLSDVLLVVYRNVIDF